MRAIENEFQDMEYPIKNPMEISSQLSNGSETIFEGENIEYPAVNIVIDLKKHLSKAPNNGFPYKESDSIICDLEYALEKEDII